MKVKLYMFSGSNAVLTAQLMLAHKGIDYKRFNMPPAAHAPLVKGRPAEVLARRVAPDYTGRVGKALPMGTLPRTLPPEWLATLQLPGGERPALRLSEGMKSDRISA